MLNLCGRGGRIPVSVQRGRLSPPNRYERGKGDELESESANRGKGGNAVDTDKAREQEEKQAGVVRGRRFLEDLGKGADVPTQELIEFIRRLWADRSQTNEYYRGLVALLGRALHQPEFFDGYPLSRCPPGLAVDLNPHDAPAQLGIRFLRENSVGLRNALKEGGLASWGDAFARLDDSCRVITGSISSRFSKTTSSSYRMAVGFVLLLLWSELLNDSFWSLPDDNLEGAIVARLEEENIKAVLALAESLRNNPLWNWCLRRDAPDRGAGD